MVSRKTFVQTSAILLFCAAAFSLDLSDVNDGLSSPFINLVDKNEGLTSFPSLNITSGGREESLGGAFTGLADDICFFDYNPAASCILENGETATFHNSWIADSNLETIAWADRFNDFGIGAKIKCFYVPFTQYNYFGDRVGGSYYSETTGTFNISYNFLHGYYFKGLAVGANLKFAWRNVPDYTDSETDLSIENSGLSQSSLGIMADLGLMLSFNAGKIYKSRDPNLRIGLSLMNLGVALTGFKSAGGVCIDDPLPTAVSAGVSYRLFKALAFTADFRQPLNFSDFSKSAKWSAGVGVDVNITDFIEIMAGFRMKGANPRISLGGEFKIKKFIFDVNYTFDLTSSATPVNHFSLSARLNLGDKGRKEKQKLCDEYYTKGLDEYAKGNIEAAVENWQLALQADKSFTPAKRWIETAQSSQKLYKRVLDIQSLD